MTGTPQTLHAIDAGMLTPLVRTLLGRDDLVVAGWTHDAFGHSLHDVYGQPRSIVRFSGVAEAGGGDLAWTLVLKVVTAAATPADPAAPGNGAREALAYGSGLLAETPGLRAPRCVGVETRPDGSWWLWLEEVVDDIGRAWPADRYMLAARHIGQFNGSRTPHVFRASYPWLSRSPLREAVGRMAPLVERVTEARHDPSVAAAVSPEAATALLALVDRRDAWLDELDRIPPALCHWDAHRANLFSRTAADGTVETIAIDWASVGWGPLGADLSKLLSQAVNFFGLDAAALPDLDAALFDHYLAGLRDAGWRGDESTVRTGYTAASAMRLIVRTAMALELAADARARAAFEQTTGQPFAALAWRFGLTLPYYLSLIEEGRHRSG